MDWRSCLFALIALLPLASCWNTISNNIAATRSSSGRQRNKVSPYIDLVFCTIREQPWSCARQESARILDVWDNELHRQWQKLKVEADHQLNATIERRGYSATEGLTKEKPSTILKKIEIGTNFMKQYLAETMDGFLGREYDYVLQNTKNEIAEAEEEEEEEEDDDDDDDDGGETNDDDAAHDDDDENDGNDNNNDDGAEEDDKAANAGYQSNQIQNFNQDNNPGDSKDTIGATDNTSNGIEFIEIQDTNSQNNLNTNNEHEEASSQPQQQLKRPGGGFGNRVKKRKGQKGQKGQVGQLTTLLVVKPEEEHGHDGGNAVSFGHGGKPGKQKRRKRKKQKPASTVVVQAEEHPTSHIGLDLLDELVGAGDLLGSGGKRKHKHPIKYGRSNGVTRGKKKKKKKALAKLVLLGTFLKAKIELLLKILGAHLQIKFFAIALIGLLINIARFWIDVKRGGVPQKVIYVEHAHHQHHYEEHGDDWGGGETSGGYWKRSLQTDPTLDENTSTDSYQPRPELDAAHYMAYRNQWQ